MYASGMMMMTFITQGGNLGAIGEPKMYCCTKIGERTYSDVVSQSTSWGGELAIEHR